MLIIIDTNKVAKEMVNSGIDPDDIRNDQLTGWSNCLVDTLESLYDVENEVLENVLRIRKE